MDAARQCGQLKVSVQGPTPAVVACHCRDCPRRTGSPFGILAYYPTGLVRIGGEATRYERSTESRGVFETYFCPCCGSTVYARAAKHPTMIGVAVGAFDDRSFPAPARSVWEERKYPWVTMPETAESFPRGRT